MARRVPGSGNRWTGSQAGSVSGSPRMHSGQAVGVQTSLSSEANNSKAEPVRLGEPRGHG
jgi:hypothetical protein